MRQEVCHDENISKYFQIYKSVLVRSGWIPELENPKIERVFALYQLFSQFCLRSRIILEM